MSYGNADWCVVGDTDKAICGHCAVQRRDEAKALIAALTAERDRLAAQLRDAQRDVKGFAEAYDRAVAEKHALTAQLAAARAALVKYAEHPIPCPKSGLGYGMNQADGCRCGLDAALAALEKP